MAWAVSASGTKTATPPTTCTFTNGSANIGVVNTCAAGDMVVFTTTGGLPTNFATFTTYYVIATGLSGSNIQVSATPGGGAITAGSAGSGTQTGTFEHVLTQPTTVGTYAFEVDTSALLVGDLAELRVYDKVDGSNYRQLWKGAYQHLQINNGKLSPGFGMTSGAQFTLKQLAASSGRAFPWSVRFI